MKKLLIASMTAALTAGVWADLTKTQLSFEDGFNKGDGFWTTETADENITVGTYGDDNVAYKYGNPAANTRAEVFGSAQNQFLKLETEAGKALWRNLAAEAGGVATVDAANSYVLDTLVQFTATDEAPTAATGDKFILWLKSDEAAGTTSLMATCGAMDGLGGIAETASVVLDANVVAGQWARVSVKALQLNGGETLGFVVFVDGVAVAAADSDAYAALYSTYFEYGGDLTTEATHYQAAKQLLPCLIGGEDNNGNALSAVGFEGTGAIDDLQIVTAADVPSFTKYDPSEEPVVNPVAPGETVSAATAKDAIAALTKAGIKAPATVTDATATAYKAKFEATATDNGNGTFSATWTVTAAAEASLKSDADAALAQTLEAVLDDKKTTVTITAQPGFYYTVLSAATVDAAEYTPNGWALAGDTVELALPEKSGTQGFYKIGISAVEQK